MKALSLSTATHILRLLNLVNLDVSVGKKKKESTKSESFSSFRGSNRRHTYLKPVTHKHSSDYGLD
jgi:hypothetical protein